MVALSTYLLIQVVNDYRAAEYRESMATGFFRLVAVGIERQPAGTLRDAWLEEASTLMDNKIVLVDAKSADFDSAEKITLLEGRAVVRVNVQHNYADIFSLVSAKEQIYLKARRVKSPNSKPKQWRFFYWMIWSIIKVKKRNG